MQCGALACAMPIVPRAAPEKPGMPILGYFVVVGSVLMGLLFAADAYMPRPEKLTFASNFDGLPPSYKGEPASRRPIPAPAIASTKPEPETTGFALASEPREQTVAQPAQETAKPAKPQPRKVVHKKRQDDDDNWFGGNNRRDFAFGSRDSFSTREREPSWRDSWASGAFDQPREMRSSRRSAARSNDFWSFR